MADKNENGSTASHEDNNLKSLSVDIPSFRPSPYNSPLPKYETRGSRRRKFPKRIILVRHGESLGNVDESAYCSISDWKIPLTEQVRS